MRQLSPFFEAWPPSSSLISINDLGRPWESSQSQRLQCGAGCHKSQMVNTDPNPPRPDEHRGVLDIHYLIGRNLGDVKRKSEDIRIGLSQVDKAGGNKEIHDSVKLEFLYPIRIQFARLVAHRRNLQSVPTFI